LETYIEPKELTENPDYKMQRQETLTGLSYATIDAPIIKTIKGLNELPCCFTIQSCYGHFLYKGQEDLYVTIDIVEYRIAYIALCVENSNSGRRLLNDLKTLTKIDPENI
jgi:hypothetical protein